MTGLVPPPGGDDRQLAARVDARFQAVNARFSTIDRRFTGTMERIQQLQRHAENADACLRSIDGRFNAIDRRIDLIEEQLAKQSQHRHRRNTWLIALSAIAATGWAAALLQQVWP